MAKRLRSLFNNQIETTTTRHLLWTNMAETGQHAGIHGRQSPDLKTGDCISPRRKGERPFATEQRNGKLHAPPFNRPRRRPPRRGERNPSLRSGGKLKSNRRPHQEQGENRQEHRRKHTEYPATNSTYRNELQRRAFHFILLLAEAGEVERNGRRFTSLKSIHPEALGMPENE